MCQLPIGVKLQSDDFIEGYTMNAAQTAVIVKELSFDFVELSGGSYSGKYATIRNNQDKYYYKHVVEELKKNGLMEKQPVIVTGGFQNVEDAEMALDDGAAMVGFVRKFLRNDKFLIDGSESNCLICNQCLKSLIKNKEVFCPQHEKEMAAKK